MRGYLVANGAAFQIAETDPHCRVTVSALPLELVPHVADLLTERVPAGLRGMVGN